MIRLIPIIFLAACTSVPEKCAKRIIHGTQFEFCCPANVKWDCHPEMEKPFLGTDRYLFGGHPAFQAACEDDNR